MHDTSLVTGELFGKVYTKLAGTVLDIGGLDINGSLRNTLTNDSKLIYTCMDMEQGKNVDIVCNAYEKFPFDDGSFDYIVSTSCFEHDPCFWMTFREMCRVVKVGGYIYINAPTNGPYHTAPGDNWRFYSDAGQALAYWSGKELEGSSYPVKVEETFHVLPKYDYWIDWVTVWKRVNEKESNIIRSEEIKNKVGPLQNALNHNGYPTLNELYTFHNWRKI